MNIIDYKILCYICGRYVNLYYSFRYWRHETVTCKTVKMGKLVKALKRLEYNTKLSAKVQTKCF